jgi:hypothetical protein
VHATNIGLNKFVRPDSPFRGRGIFKLIPTLVGLATIPILPHVLDPAIDIAMDNTSRPLFRVTRETFAKPEEVSAPEAERQN